MRVRVRVRVRGEGKGERVRVGAGGGLGQPVVAAGGKGAEEGIELEPHLGEGCMCMQDRVRAQ